MLVTISLNENDDGYWNKLVDSCVFESAVAVDFQNSFYLEIY